MNRVVVTGIGALTPIGNDVETFWKNSKEGVCGVDFIKSMDTENLEIKIAAELKDFNINDYIDKKESRRLDKFVQYGLVAAKEAFENSKLELDKINPDRFSVIYGSGIGGYNTHESEFKNVYTKGLKRVSPMYVPMAIINAVCAQIAIKYNARGMCTSVVTACASATNNIGDAFRHIKHGYSDIVICGGSEAPITPIGVAGFQNMKALNANNDPLRASIPFDKERSGFVIGEGAGALVLESLEHATKRGAKILAEVVGYGATCDAFHITSPSPEGYGASNSMKNAIDEAGIKPSEVSYINAHGTSTPYNDLFETRAVKTVFGDDAKNIPISSTKSMTGHLLGGAGAIESVICFKALEEGFIPPTIGLNETDEELDLDYVPNVGRKADINYALTNSLGFGGHNASLLFKRWE